MRIVVVGASLAGVRTVQALRRDGVDARITLIDAATVLPCDRPPLSKTYLVDIDSVPRPVLTDAQLDELDVELILDRRATGLEPADHRVTIHNGSSLDYDVLVVATGSAPRQIPGLAPLPGMHVLRTAQDAAAIRAALAAGARTVIVGGGFIGAEVASAVRRLGLEATVVEQLPALMLRGLGPNLGEVFGRRHARAGVTLRLGVGVVAVLGDGRVEALRLSDGTLLPADLVVVGVGTVPETAWLNGCGLDLADGVRCDEHLRAVGVPDVYVAGDAARWWHPRYREYVRMQHWTNAAEHGPVVAANIGGRPIGYDALPYVWSDQLGARLQVFGRVGAADEVRYVVGGADTDRFVAVTGDQDAPRAVVGFGAVRELMPYRALLLAGAGWDSTMERAAAGA